MFIFVFVTLPAYDVVRGVWLTFGVAIVPALLKLFEKNEVDVPHEPGQSSSQELPSIRRKTILFKVFDTLAFLAQLSVLFLWLICDILHEEASFAKALLPVALALTSIGWWENYVSENTTFVVLGESIRSLKKDINRCRVILTTVSSFWSLIATLAYITVYFALRNQECVEVLYFQRAEAPGCFGANSTNVMTSAQIDVQMGENPFWIAIVQVLSAGLCYTFVKTACKIMLQHISFSLPLVLVTPVTFLILAGLCFQWHSVVDYFYDLSIMPSLLFWHCDASRGNSSFVDFTASYTSDYYMPIVVAWWLSLVWLTWHVWKPKMERLAKTEK